MIHLAIGVLALLLAATVVLVARGRIDMLGVPLLAAALFAFIYLWQPGFLLRQDKLFRWITEAQALKGLVIAALMYAALVVGWLSFRARPTSDGRWDWNYRTLFLAGLGLASLSVLLFLVFIRASGGLLAFYSSPHGAAGAWQETTAYVYLAPRLMTPALILMILGCVRARLGRLEWAAVVLFVTIALVHAVLHSSRGAFFALVSTLFVTWYLANRRRPGLRRALVGGSLTALALLLLVGYRGSIHLGRQFQRAPSLSEALLSTTDIGRSQIAVRRVGREFLYHAAVLDTADALGKYGLGFDWLYLVAVHPIPRVLWPEKPYQGDWNLGVDKWEIANHIHWTPERGANAGLVADVYRQFGLASVLFWFLLGRFARRLLENAAQPGDPPAVLVYVTLYAFGLYLLAQDLDALIVPLLYALIPGLLLLRLCRVPAAAEPATEWPSPETRLASGDTVV